MRSGSSERAFAMNSDVIDDESFECFDDPAPSLRQNDMFPWLSVKTETLSCFSSPLEE